MHREQRIIDVLLAAFCDLMAVDPDGFRRKFRKMAGTPFAFYRGSACLFYRDLKDRPDPFVDERTERIWIHGDLHAQNFGTYLNGAGRLVFDVNDFDEAYLGPFSWDLRRMVASVDLIGREKAMPDTAIATMIARYARSYLAAVRQLAAGQPVPPLTLAAAAGPLLSVLHLARRKTRVGLLDALTVIDDSDRRFRSGVDISPVSPSLRAAVLDAFDDYLDTIPAGKRRQPPEYHVNDVVARSGVGIGSARLPSFNLLLEGHSDALENDVVLYMKQAQAPTLRGIVPDQAADSCFAHDGERTAVSQRALQTDADPWLGYTSLAGHGQLVAEVSPYAEDLDWTELVDLDTMCAVLDDLGRATARLHCLSDVDSRQRQVTHDVGDAIARALDGSATEFVDGMVQFGLDYGAQVLTDHALFVDAFRNGKLPGV